MVTIDQFDYQLPKERIAHTPMQPRDHSRLMVIDRQTRQLAHHHFYDLPDLLTPDTVLVRNNTKVIPARIQGQKTSGGQVELLLTKRSNQTEQGEVWECLTKPGLKPGQKVTFAHSTLVATCSAITNYTRQIQFTMFGQELFSELNHIGHTPIPPYIPAWDEADEPHLRQLYQTTYAKHQGSAAAPTAGLHFTPELDQRLLDKGIHIEEVTLHVGLGTFLRVKTPDITQHVMHQEWFEL
jgi:S-adenosylmethionine:tRNA ribosyltransferase-isomerase